MIKRLVFLFALAGILSIGATKAENEVNIRQRVDLNGQTVVDTNNTYTSQPTSVSSTDDTGTGSLDGGFIISAFDSQVNLQSNGAANVTETITADFGQNPHHGIYRTLPTRYNSLLYGRRASGLVVQSVDWQHPGQAFVVAPYTTGITKNGLQLKIGDANHLDTGQVSYRLHYQAAPVHQNQADGQHYLWNVTGADWTIPLKNIHLTLTAPEGWLSSVCYAPLGQQQKCQTVATKTVLTASADILEPGEQLTAGGLLPATTFPPFASPLMSARLTQIALPFLLPLIVLGLLLRQTFRIKRRKHSQSIIPVYDPPAIEPALADAFYDGNLTGEPLPATIIDMARRGELTITEEKKFLWGKDYILTVIKRPSDPARPIATAITPLLFPVDTTAPEVRTLSSLRNNPTLAQAIQTTPAKSGWPWLVDHGYFRSRDESAGLVGTLIGVVIIITAGILFADITNGQLGLSVFWPLSVGLAGFILLFSQLFLKGSRLTEQGDEFWRQIEGFYLFMHTAERFRQQWLERQGELDAYLPWAMVFGLTSEWLKKLESLNIHFNPPTWYVGTSNFSSGDFSQSFSSAMSSFSSAGTSSGGAGGGGGGGGGGGW